MRHGAASFLKESMMERSDKFETTINEDTGLIDTNPNINRKTTIQYYAMKMMLQELETIFIAPRIVTEMDQDMKNPIFDYIRNNIKK